MHIYLIHEYERKNKHNIYWNARSLWFDLFDAKILYIHVYIFFHKCLSLWFINNLYLVMWSSGYWIYFFFRFYSSFFNSYANIAKKILEKSFTIYRIVFSNWFQKDKDARIKVSILLRSVYPHGKLSHCFLYMILTNEWFIIHVTIILTHSWQKSRGPYL